MTTERRNWSIIDPSIHLTPLVLAGLLVASFTAGAVLASGLTVGAPRRPGGRGPAGASAAVPAASQFEGLTTEQRAIDFRLSEKGLPTQSELTTELTAERARSTSD